MRGGFLLVLITIFFMSLSFVYSEDEGWIKTSYGSYKIERFWEETVGDYTYTYTLVSYKNTTNKQFKKLVSIRAIVYDADDNMLDTNTRSFFSYEYGAIIPGFEGVVKIPIECDKGRASSVSVSIEKAR